jgi:hypothetical protein
MSKSNGMNLLESRLSDQEQAFSNGKREGRRKHSYIASRAYQRWQHRGCPEGSAEDHWLPAEREFASLGTATPAQGTASLTAASLKPARTAAEP